MYVDYFLIDGCLPKYYVSQSGDLAHKHPSECMWMVPGTVDPMDD